MTPVSTSDLDIGALRAADLPGMVSRLAAEQARLAGLQAQIALRFIEGSGRSPEDDDEWLDARRAADYLTVPVSWVRDKARRSIIRSYRMGRYVRFRRSELDEDVAGCSVMKN